MKAAVQYAPFDVRVEEVPDPSPGPGEIKVKIAYCGICGTDPEVFDGSFGLMKSPNWPKGPRTSGHEASGTIEELGTNLLQGYRVGQRVAMNFRSPCGVCYYCRNKMEHCCEHVSMSGGAFAQYAIYRESAIYPLPDDVSFETGALLEPLTVALHAVDQGSIAPGKSVAISGAGPIGLLALQLAIKAGATKVLVSEPIAEKRKLAEKFGADVTVNPLTEDVEKAGRDLSGGRGFDTVIEASGKLAAATQSILLADKCATIVWVGVYPDNAEIPVNPFHMYVNELTIRSARIAPYSFLRGVNLLSKLDLAPLITDTYPLEDIVKAIENHNKGTSIKALIRPWRV